MVDGQQTIDGAALAADRAPAHRRAKDDPLRLGRVHHRRSPAVGVGVRRARRRRPHQHLHAEAGRLGCSRRPPTAAGCRSPRPPTGWRAPRRSSSSPAPSRGSLFNIVGNGAGVFERIESELGGYYLLGVDSAPSDKDGKAHPIRVEVGAPGRHGPRRAARWLRHRTTLEAAQRREAMIAALTTPLPISALPLRVATFSLKGPESGRLQLLIHADIGTDYSAPRVVSLGYTISDSDRPHRGNPGRRRASAADHERRPVSASVLRRAPACRRAILAEARGRRRRPRRDDRAPDSRRAAPTPGQPVQRPDGRRAGVGRGAAAADDRLPGRLRNACTRTSKPTARRPAG